MDEVVRLGYFPAPGETISGDLSDTAPGSKGLNASVALRRVGMNPVNNTEMACALAAFDLETTHIGFGHFPSVCACVFLD